MSHVRLAVIVAVADNGVIGAGGDLPWHLPADLRHFKATTLGHPVVVGGVTHRSIVARLGRPLPGRTSVVVSRGPAADGVTTVPDVATACATAAEVARAEGRARVFVIGGLSVYAQVLDTADEVHLTRVHASPDGDTAMPVGWLERFALVETLGRAQDDEGLACTFERYEAR